MTDKKVPPTSATAPSVTNVPIELKEETIEENEPKIIFMDQNALIRETVELMVKKQISSVLVTDEQMKICGILTERDIVRKFTLIDMDDKMERKISTIMTRSIEFVSQENAVEAAKTLFVEKNIRHFPILNGKTNHKDNVVGFLSLSDIFRGYVEQDRKKTPVVVAKEAPITIVILTLFQATWGPITEIFKAANIKWEFFTDLNKIYNKYPKTHPPMIFDLDGWDQNKLKEYVGLSGNYKEKVLLVTQNLSLVGGLRKLLLAKKNHFILIKPLDTAYAIWLIKQKKAK